MASVRGNSEVTLKKSHFARLHEKIQNKYEEMQRKLEKSKSVDSLSSLREDYEYKEPRYASSADINRIDMMNNDMHFEKNGFKFSAIEEEIHKNDVTFQHITVREASISESDITPSPCERIENEKNTNRFFGDDFCRLSLESLNELGKDSDEYGTPAPTPPPTTSIRDKIGLRINAVKDRRKQKEKEKLENEKKDKSREKVEKFILSNIKQDKVKTVKRRKIATVSIALIEATDLETDILEEKTRLLFCRFRLGSEKYKSKVIKSNTSKAKWQELFNFNLYEDNIVEVSLWEKDFCVGRSNIDLSEMEKERTHKMLINLEADTGSTKLFILLTITGFSLISLDEFQETQKRLGTVAKNSPWYNYKDDSGQVGSLMVIVYGAKGLVGNECHCVLELDNERLQTQTDVKTQEPNWMKIFTFEVTDITSILDVTIHDEKKSEDIGCLSIPLLNIKSGEKKWYALKDSSLRDRAKGNNPRILLEMNLTWKLVKASVRVINTKEVKYLEAKQKLDRHTFSKNLARAKVVFNWTMDAFRVMKSCFEWESRRMNIIALTIWLLFCWFFKIWMLPLLILIPFFWYRPPKYCLVHWRDYMFKRLPLEDDGKKEEKNQSLRQKINSLTEMVQSVQNFIGAFANLGESIKNLFNYTVPFVSFLAIFIIVMIAFVMFMIPTKYIFMIWGIHKFTRKILRPNRIPNNEMLDLLSRVPNDEILLNCEEIPLEEVPEEDVIN